MQLIIDLFPLGSNQIHLAYATHEPFGMRKVKSAYSEMAHRPRTLRYKITGIMKSL